MKLSGNKISHILFFIFLPLYIIVIACVDDNDLTLVFPTEANERALRDNGEIILPDKNIELALWDWSAIDHDTISVFINNKTIVKDLFLRGSDNKYVVQTTLSKTRNDLVIMTTNEGSLPPNSLAFSIKSGEFYVKKGKETRMKTNELYTLVIE